MGAVLPTSCARDTIDHEAAAPPSSVMNSRRPMKAVICFPSRKGYSGTIAQSYRRALRQKDLEDLRPRGPRVQPGQRYVRSLPGRPVTKSGGKDGSAIRSPVCNSPSTLGRVLRVCNFVEVSP